MSEKRERVIDTKTVDSPWDKIKNSQVKSMRQPNSTGADTGVTSSKVKTQGEAAVMDEKKGISINDGIVINSKLNVNAAEFIPISQKTQSNESADDALSYLRNELNCLTLNPGKYNEISHALCDTLKPYSSDEHVLKSVIQIILNECISESNLRYNGARLCSEFNKVCGSTFRKILLTRYKIRDKGANCQEEHAKFISSQTPNDPSYQTRICGFGLMLAELFLQIQIEEKCIVVLGNGLLNILQNILMNETEKSIKCVCQVLKLTGVKLEEIAASSDKNQLDELFNRLQIISAYPDLDPNLRFIIRSVLNMRTANWGQTRCEQPSEPAQNAIDATNTTVNSDGCDEPVFFGPDGKIITEEETSFLHDNIPLSEDIDDYVCDQDSMDEEVCNDFEEFLKLSEKKGENRK